MQYHYQLCFAQFQWIGLQLKVHIVIPSCVTAFSRAGLVTCIVTIVLHYSAVADTNMPYCCPNTLEAISLTGGQVL